MAIDYMPETTEVSLTGQEEFEANVLNLLKETINGLHRVEKQLEKVTDEEIDSDESNIA